jgi:hypothetical protein
VRRDERRAAREAKRGIFSRSERTALVMVISDDAAANDGPCCLRCGQEGPSSDECRRPIPACSAVDGPWLDARERGFRAGSQ